MYFIALRIIVLQLFHQTYITVKADVKVWKDKPMNLIDYSDNYNDVFFDRLVAFVLDIANYTGHGDDKKTTITLGILLSNGRVLTSYNPFREIVRNKDLIEKTHLAVFKGRTRYLDEHCSYNFDIYKLKCGRQIVYFPDDEIPNELWHGNDRRNSPVHDLMVLRMSQDTLLSHYDENEYVWWLHWPKGKQSTYHPKAFVTSLAKSTDSIGESFKFASLGYRNDTEIKRWHHVHRTTYKLDGNVLVNCEEWIPREWGRFICVKNVHDFAGVGSSAMLFSGTKLFGVGCFAFFRSKESILVFTDVRPYYELIMNTCTDKDMKE